MTFKPFPEWIKEQREKLKLKPSDCIKRVNAKFGTQHKSNLWSLWENSKRYNKDKINFEIVRKVACGLQVSEADALAVAGLPVSDKVLSCDLPNLF